jgi:hypothetical protein
LYGDALENAIVAFEVAIADFFPKRKAEPMKKAFAAIRKQANSLWEAQEKSLGQIASTDIASN